MTSSDTASFTISTTDQLSPADWDSFVAAHPDGHLLQTSGWATLKGCVGWQVERAALRQGETIVAGGQVLLHRLPWGQTLAYVPKGPLVDWRNAAQVRALLAGLCQVVAGHRPALLKLEPDLPDSPQLDLILQSYGLQRGHPVQPRSTIHLDLGQGSEAVLAGMKQKWRYNVRLAERKGVTVRPMDAADLPTWHAMNAETGQRDGFGVHQPAYYQAAFELLPAHQACWLLAEFEGQPLAAIAVFALGSKSWYMWGASSSLERRACPITPCSGPASPGPRSAAVPATICGASPTRWARTRQPSPRTSSIKKGGCGASIASSRALAGRWCATPAPGTCRCRRWAGGSITSRGG